MATQNDLTTARIQLVPIEKIVIGQRRRKKLGSLAGLISSIEERGLIHPITLDQDYTLIAGQRRLSAFEKLGRTEIPARIVACRNGDLRAIELEENTARLDLESYEQSRQRLAEIETAEQRAREKEQRDRAKEADGVSVPSRNRKGRPKGRKSGSVRAAAEASGYPLVEVQKTRTHIRTAEQYPFMQRADWKKTHVLAAAKALKELPKDERGRAANVVDQEGVPAPRAVKILQNLGTLTEDDRAAIYAGNEDTRPHERSVALAKAAALPVPPEPALICAGVAEQQIKSALKLTRTEAARQALKAALESITEAIRILRKAHANGGE